MVNDILVKRKRNLRKSERIYNKNKTAINKSIYEDLRKIQDTNLKSAKQKYNINQNNDAVFDQKKLYRISNKLLDRSKNKKLPDKSSKDNADSFSIFFAEKVNKLVLTLNVT